MHELDAWGWWGEGGSTIDEGSRVPYTWVGWGCEGLLSSDPKYLKPRHQPAELQPA